MSAIICGTIFVGMLLANISILKDFKDKILFEKWFVAGGLIGFTLLCVENLTNAGLSRFAYELFGLNRDIRLAGRFGPLIFNPGMSAASLYLWPLGLILFRQYSKVIFIPVVGFCFLGIFLGVSTAPILALIVGLSTMIITGLANRFGPKLLVFATAIYTLLAPAIPNLLPDPTDPQSNLSRYYALSDIHRYLIWNTTYNHIKDKPIFGHGLDSTRALYSHEDRITTKVIMKATGESAGILAEPIPLHPHNAILQVWLELGVVGAGLLAFFLVKILNLVQKVTRNHWEAAVCYGVFTSGLTIASLSYGIWQSWWLGSLFLAGAFMAVTIQGSANKNVTAL